MIQKCKRVRILKWWCTKKRKDEHGGVKIKKGVRCENPNGSKTRRGEAERGGCAEQCSTLSKTN